MELTLHRTSRTSWPLGRITQIFPDQEGYIRKVEVFSKGGKYLRTLDKLIPLELHSIPDDTKQSEVLEKVRKQPLRKAQQTAKGAIQRLIAQDLV